MKTSEKKETAMNTTEAAAKLAEAMRANIAAGYEACEAKARLDWLEGPFWNEEGFRRRTCLDVAVANQNATHLACIEALAEHDSVMQVERIVNCVREGCADVDDVDGKYGDLMSKIDAAVRACADLTGPLSDENRSSNDSACEP